MVPATDMLGAWHEYIEWWDCLGPKKNSHISLTCSVRTYRGFGAFSGKMMHVSIV